MDGKPAEAREGFQKAIAFDETPHRCTPEMNRSVRSAAEGAGALLVDVAAFFDESSPDGIPGDELFMDNVHPWLDHQARIGGLAAEAVLTHRGIEVSERERRKMRDAMARTGLALPPELITEGYAYEAMLAAGTGRLHRSLRLCPMVLEREPDHRKILALEKAVREVLVEEGGLPAGTQ